MGFDVTEDSTLWVCDNWIDEVRTIVPECMVVAVGNKIDLVYRRVISTEKARAHFEEKGVPYFETSAKTGEGVNELFGSVTRMIIGRNNENKEVPDADEDQTPQNGQCIIC